MYKIDNNAPSTSSGSGKPRNMNGKALNEVNL